MLRDFLLDNNTIVTAIAISKSNAYIDIINADYKRNTRVIFVTGSTSYKLYRYNPRPQAAPRDLPFPIMIEINVGDPWCLEKILGLIQTEW